MAWQQQQQQGNYDNYGGYVDPGYGQNDQQHQYYANPSAGMQYNPQNGGSDQVTFDMYSSGDESSNFNHGGYNTQSNPNTGPSQNPGAATMPNMNYYNPNARSEQPHPNQQNAYGNSQQPPNLASVAGMFGGGAGQIISNPVLTGFAAQEGEKILQKGQEEINKYISIGQLKYYFAVDNNYVTKKLALLLFPFAQKDWAIKYNQDEPVQPKYDVNAPDLYIPCMGYITYILIVGYILGLKNAFSPDNLASTASSSLVWLILEIGLIYLTLTVMSINTTLAKWDILSFSCYKYVGVITVLVIGGYSSLTYYLTLAYVSSALFFFLLRTLRLRIEPEVHGMEMHGKRKLYMMFLYAGLQPLLIWWLTSWYVPLNIGTQNSYGETPPTPSM